MNACMHDYANTNGEIMVRLSHMLESRVTTPLGKDYGFICNCNKGSTKFPNCNYPYEYIGI
jgi:hypothetical protein